MTDLFHPMAAPFHLPGDNGEAVVVIHGFTGIPGHWRLAAEVLNQRGYTVVAPRLPGHGTSIEDMDRYGAGDWIRAVVDAAVSVGNHRRIHLAGLSLGGLLAVLCAGPTNAATVTTISAPLRFRRRSIYLAPFLHRFRPYTPWPPAAPPTEPETAALFITYPGFPTRRAADLMVVARHARKTARRLRRPALVVQSAGDETVHPGSGRLLARLLGPATQTLWLNDSRHNALLDRERHLIHEALLHRLAPA
ncbi:MAG: alpha/beta fold hydrolase [Acidimicrobiia bacterium]